MNDSEVVATRTTSGGLAGLNNTLTAHADGTLHFSDRRFGRDETREVPPERIRSLGEALTRPEWHELEVFYGRSVPDGFETVVEGGGKRTGVASPSAEPVEVPPILVEVLAHLNDLWPEGDVVGRVEPPNPIESGIVEPNLFGLEVGDVRISYGVLRARREFLDYRDETRELSFSGEAGEIHTQNNRIGRLITVELNRDEANADAALITLTLLLPQVNDRGGGASFETVAIRTTHLTGLLSGFPEGPQQLYEMLPLEGTAHHAD